MPGNWPVLFGKGPTEKARATGTSPAAYFALRGEAGNGAWSLRDSKRPEGTHAEAHCYRASLLPYPKEETKQETHLSGPPATPSV